MGYLVLGSPIMYVAWRHTAVVQSMHAVGGWFLMYCRFMVLHSYTFVILYMDLMLVSIRIFMCWLCRLVVRSISSTCEVIMFLSYICQLAFLIVCAQMGEPRACPLPNQSPATLAPRNLRLRACIMAHRSAVTTHQSAQEPPAPGLLRPWQLVAAGGSLACPTRGAAGMAGIACRPTKRPSAVLVRPTAPLPATLRYTAGRPVHPIT